MTKPLKKSTIHIVKLNVIPITLRLNHNNMREGSPRREDSGLIKKGDREKRRPGTAGVTELSKQDLIEAGNVVGQDFTSLLKESKETEKDEK